MHSYSLKVITQAPIEIRTRTRTERRHFKLIVRVYSSSCNVLHPRKNEVLSLNATLLYADRNGNRIPQVTCGKNKQGLLVGGTLHRKLPPLEHFIKTENGGSSSAYCDIVFADLNMHEPSSRHKDREFCFRFDLIKNGVASNSLATVESNPSYAYSHPKVLRRRREVTLKALSGVGTMPLCELLNLGELPRKQRRMHLVGGPFIRSPRLSIVFRFIGHGLTQGDKKSSYEVQAKNMEHFSDSVLFFDFPKSTKAFVESNSSIDVEIRVTNNSRHFSNCLQLKFVDLDSVKSKTGAQKHLLDANKGPASSKGTSINWDEMPTLENGLKKQLSGTTMDQPKALPVQQSNVPSSSSVNVFSNFIPFSTKDFDLNEFESSSTMDKYIDDLGLFSDGMDGNKSSSDDSFSASNVINKCGIKDSEEEAMVDFTDLDFFAGLDSFIDSSSLSRTRAYSDDDNSDFQANNPAKRIRSSQANNPAKRIRSRM